MWEVVLASPDGGSNVNGEAAVASPGSGSAQDWRGLAAAALRSSDGGRRKLESRLRSVGPRSESDTAFLVEREGYLWNR